MDISTKYIVKFYKKDSHKLKFMLYEDSYLKCVKHKLKYKEKYIVEIIKPSRVK